MLYGSIEPMPTISLTMRSIYGQRVALQSKWLYMQGRLNEQKHLRIDNGSLWHRSLIVSSNKLPQQWKQYDLKKKKKKSNHRKVKKKLEILGDNMGFQSH
jgi:hypothetical protein